jgi:hypothetical protein
LSKFWLYTLNPCIFTKFGFIAHMLLLIAHVLLLTAHRSLLVAHKIASLCCPVFQTFDIVKYNAWILHVPTNLHPLHKLHTTTWKVHKHFENKHFVLWLPWEPTTIDKFEGEWHNTIYCSHSTTKKYFDLDTKFR